MPLEILNLLEWTGQKTELIELIYGLYATNRISSGKVSIKKLTVVFGKLFKVELGDLYHTFHRMKGRSKNLTPFLDALKSGFTRSYKQLRPKVVLLTSNKNV